MAMIQINGKNIPVQAVFFDKDGTLIDFSSIWLPWAEQVLTVFSDSDRRETAEKSLGISLANGTVDPEGPLAIGSMQDVRTILANVLYVYGKPWHRAFHQVIERIDHLDETADYLRNLQPVEGAHEFLRSLKNAGVKTAVVTADDSKTASAHLQKLGIDRCFDTVIGADEVKRTKPYPDMVKLAAERLDIRLEETMMIGDTNSDMIVGRRGRMCSTVGIVTYADSTAHLTEADFTVSSYHELTCKS
ncbi:HAD family hydrolase [Salisediminibacterium halotolerans]|uniref:Phosphoglycolate phosphatase n=1 Tax=Salisediminibacterium halotolerans TaxID=517425 RepID=A0A1H9UB90_9BACI|nr:HAD family hydrolase [Salisediminibacterium haloalkalitolerans]SES06424.1 phosphoglycolate phosphatase [Salisediminibacterium haloalkalitolerans]